MNRRMMVNARSAEEQKSNSWNSFSEYMNHKIVKLRQQSEWQASEFTTTTTEEENAKAAMVTSTSKEREESGGVTVPVLQGVVAWVNGRIKLEQNEFRRIVFENGGLIEHYFMDAVTHIICNELALSKIHQLIRKKHPPVVVRCDWVMASIAARRQVPVADFLLVQLPQQPRIDKYFNSITPPPSPSSGVVIRQQQQQQVEGSGSAKKYFKYSRLHFIGLWSSKSKELTAELLAARDALGQKAEYSGKLGVGTSRVVLHVDMDCFFVSVLLRDRPELLDKPVAVAHSLGTVEQRGSSDAAAGGNSEISSCNYVARKKGVRAGMWMTKARKECPELVVLSYDFPAYDRITHNIYSIFCRIAPVVQAVSCDEAYLELPADSDPMKVASHIRKEIYSITGCPASVGAGSSMLLARIATGLAKPNGQIWLRGDEVSRILETLPVAKLPGVGWKRAEILQQRTPPIRTCGDLRSRMTLSSLQSLFGNRVGKLMWQQAMGKDSQPVQVLKGQTSISAEMNYGMRYTESEQPLEFIRELADGLSRRLLEKGLHSGTITLKLMRAKEGAPNPVKFQGHGICDTFNRSTSLSRPTNDKMVIADVAISLLDALSCPPSEIRGIGIKLSSFFDSSSGMRIFQTSRHVGKWECRAEGAMKSWLNTGLLLDNDENIRMKQQQLPRQQKADYWKRIEAGITRSQVDPDVLEELPAGIREELEAHLALSEFRKQGRVTCKRSSPSKRSLPGSSKRCKQPRSPPSGQSDLKMYLNPVPTVCDDDIKRKEEAGKSSTTAPSIEEDGENMEECQWVIFPEPFTVVRPALYKWLRVISNGNGPTVSDLGLLFEYVSTLISEGMVSDAAACLRTIGRVCSSSSVTKAADALVRTIQVHSRRTLGYPLAFD